MVDMNLLEQGPLAFFAEPPELIGGLYAAGFAKVRHGIFGGRHRRVRYYGLVYIESGMGSYEDDTGVSMRWRPGDFIFIQPGIGHIYEPDQGTESAQYYVLFAGPIFDILRSSQVIGADLPRVFGCTVASSKLADFKHFSHADPVSDSRKRLIQTWDFLKLLTEIMPRIQMSGAAAESWAEKAMSRVATDGASISAIAFEFDMPVRQFRQRFIQATGLSPMAYKVKHRMDRACHMLKSGNRLVKDIAQELGYVNEFVFSKAFHRSVGFSPRAYRQSVHPLDFVTPSD